jgi:hypothetical protein
MLSATNRMGTLSDRGGQSRQLEIAGWACCGVECPWARAIAHRSNRYIGDSLQGAASTYEVKCSIEVPLA